MSYELIVHVTIPALTSYGGRGKRAWSVTGWIGYYVAHMQCWQPRAQKYTAWKEHVQLCTLPHIRVFGNRPIASEGYYLVTQAFFRNKNHGDPTNIQKGIEDALVGRTGKASTGRFLFIDDKHLAGKYGAPQYDKERPRVEVWIYCVGPVQGRML